MSNKKEMAGDYEILQSIRLGGALMVLGYHPKDKDAAYMTSYQKTNFLGDLVYTEVVSNADYLEVMRIFVERLQDQAAKVKAFRASRNVPFSTLGVEHCRRRGNDESLAGKLIILRPSSMAPEYRTADCQLGFAVGGFGCSPGAGGRAVYFRELYSGEECRWEVGDILGIADVEKLPQWAKEKLAECDTKRTPQKKERGEAR